MSLTIFLRLLVKSTVNTAIIPAFYNFSKSSYFYQIAPDCFEHVTKVIFKKATDFLFFHNTDKYLSYAQMTQKKTTYFKIRGIFRLVLLGVNFFSDAVYFNSTQKLAKLVGFKKDNHFEVFITSNTYFRV